MKNGKRKYPMRVAWDDTSWPVKADWPRMKPTSIKLVGCVWKDLIHELAPNPMPCSLATQSNYDGLDKLCWDFTRLQKHWPPKSCSILYFFIVHENLCLHQFYSFRKAWMASIIYRAQLVVLSGCKTVGYFQKKYENSSIKAEIFILQQQR